MRSFWDTIGYIVNGIVFFFAGSSAVNFFVRCDHVPPLPQLRRARSALCLVWRTSSCRAASFPLCDLCAPGLRGPTSLRAVHCHYYCSSATAEK